MVKDRYRYYRVEAGELVEGLTRGVLELERNGANADAVRRLLRLAHTLKGASRVVKLPEVADHAHTIEDLLAPHREEPGESLERPTVDRLLGELDGIRARLAVLAAPPTDSAAREPLPAAPEETFRTVRVELSELDEVLQTTARLGAVVDRLAVSAAEADSPFAHHREELGRELDDLRERIFRLRLVPAESVFSDIRRTARDAAASLGKSVELDIGGGDTRVDANVLAPLRGALLHVVRNAVAHGIEDPAERAALGKSPEGRISVAVTRAGQRAIFSCSDDGRGIDEPAVKEAASRRGVLSAETAAGLGQSELIELLLQGGLSTSPRVTDLSGRGVGLETVGDTVRKLKGEVAIRSTPGAGTTVELAVPLSLSSLRVLAVHAGGAAVLIPLDAIRGTVKIDRARVCNAPEGRTLVWGDRAVPLIALASLVGAEPAVERSEPRIAVVLRGAREELALGVDQVLDAREIIVQSLPPSARADALVAGVAFDLASVPRIVLAPSELDAAAIAIREPAAAPRRETPDLPVLVVDDSLTTRMLEQTILEAAGYVVDVAVSAEEALAKAAERRYGLFIVDVEMPGMNGFEFVERTRADTRFRNIPCILVTSRNAPEDRRRGADAGAAAYFAKSEFSQDALIRSIRGLLR